MTEVPRPSPKATRPLRATAIPARAVPGTRTSKADPRRDNPPEMVAQPVKVDREQTFPHDQEGEVKKARNQSNPDCDQKNCPREYAYGLRPCSTLLFDLGHRSP